MIEIFITFAAFTLAFFALVNRIIVFRLSMSMLTMPRILWILILLGLVALLNEPFKQIFLNDPTLINSTAEYYNLVTSNDYISYGYQAAVLIWNATLVVLVIYLFYKLITPAKFSRKKSKAYFDGCSLLISCGVEADVQRLTTEISYSIPLIFDYAYHYDNEAGQYALASIDLFSDKIFCKNIINHNPRTLYIIFETVINNCEQSQVAGRSLINQLISLMFTEPESQLNREELYHGLGKFGTFKKLIFGSLNFLNSSYQPLTGFYIYNRDDFDAKSINKYFEIIEYALKIYLKCPDNSPSIFFAAFNVIEEIINKNLLLLAHKPDNEIHLTSAYDNIITCSVGISSLIHFISQNAEEFPQSRDVTQQEYSFFKNDRNIYGAIAHGIYSVIEQLSRNEHFFESIRHLLVEIYQLSITDSLPIQALQKRLNILLTDKIEDNLTKLLYPAVTASLIYAFGLCEPEETSLEIHKILLKELKQKYLRTYESNSEIALDMLPKDTEIDISSKKLVRKHPWQWIRDKSLQELSLDDN
ncbi:TPA: hypothetical protein ACYA1C_002833 [Legionella pneumophila]|nr:hypothetical protein [Legionella pneumophila]